jgi:peptidoglycan/LPS O-acetylase OafA/YrhL
VVLLFTADIRSKPMYYGLFLLCSTSVAGILSELLRHPEGRLARGLSSKPLQGAGEMTYGIYLWHWPVLMIVAQYTSWPEFPTIATQVVITFLVAAVSFRWLERPILVRYGPRFPRTTPERERAHRERMAAMPPVSEPAPVEVGATSDLEPDAAPAASQSAVL